MPKTFRQFVLKTKFCRTLLLVCFVCPITERALLGWDETPARRKAAQGPKQQELSESREWRDVPYGPVPGSQTLDLFLPQAREKPVPLVVWIHGGAWQAGDKGNHPASSLINAGFAVASINYRLSTVAAYPAQLQDCQAAIRFLRSNSGKYGIDGNRIGVWGGSAGGHLASMLGVLSNSRSKATRVQAVCNWCGPSDLFAAMSDTPKDSPLNIVEVLWKLFLGPDASNQRLRQSIPAEQRKRLLAAASPINYVSRKAPPFLIVHGDADKIVPIIQSQRFVEVLRTAGVDVDFHSISGAGHDLRNHPECIADTVNFFQRHLKNAQPDQAPHRP